MPGREIPLVNDEIYHVVNRGIASQPIFLKKSDYLRALSSIFYYQNKNAPGRYSFLLRLPREAKKRILEQLKMEKDFLVEILAFCLMPNHVHLLLKQKRDNGISMFMANWTNSYTRYFNSYQEREGPLFQGKFKAVRVLSEAQLAHISRYIHLNPYSSFVVKNLAQLESYPYSSLPEYLGAGETDFCQKELIFGSFYR